MKKLKITVFLLCFLVSLSITAQVEKAPNRSEGEGLWDQLIIRGVTLVNGTLESPVGSVDTVVENNQTVSVQTVGYPGVNIDDSRRPQLREGGKELDAEGMYSVRT